MSLQGKTLFISGGSRGIGLAIAVRAARDGANVTIAAKTTEPNPRIPGTIYSAAEQIEQAGGKAIDGTMRVLNVEPTSIHQRTPLILGSQEEVEIFERMRDDETAVPASETGATTSTEKPRCRPSVRNVSASPERSRPKPWSYPMTSSSTARRSTRISSTNRCGSYRDNASVNDRNTA